MIDTTKATVSDKDLAGGDIRRSSLERAMNEKEESIIVSVICCFRTYQ